MSLSNGHEILNTVLAIQRRFLYTSIENKYKKGNSSFFEISSYLSLSCCSSKIMYLVIILFVFWLSVRIWKSLTTILLVFVGIYVSDALWWTLFALSTRKKNSAGII